MIKTIIWTIIIWEIIRFIARKYTQIKFDKESQEKFRGEKNVLE